MRIYILRPHTLHLLIPCNSPNPLAWQKPGKKDTVGFSAVQTVGGRNGDAIVGFLAVNVLGMASAIAAHTRM